jgi:hypothetical protein
LAQKGLQRREFAEPKLHSVSGCPKFIALVQNAGPDLTKPIAVDAPGTDGSAVAHLLDDQFSAGCA